MKPCRTVLNHWKQVLRFAYEFLIFFSMPLFFVITADFEAASASIVNTANECWHFNLVQGIVPVYSTPCPVLTTSMSIFDGIYLGTALFVAQRFRICKIYVVVKSYVTRNLIIYVMVMRLQPLQCCWLWHVRTHFKFWINEFASDLIVTIFFYEVQE